MDEHKASRILIFGKNGQVGYELCRTLSTLGEIYAVDIDECDLTDKASIINTLDGFKPTVIANAAAYTAVDKAERERELAFKLNADAPGIMADWAAKHDSLMIHYSTDYVFDGTKKEPPESVDACFLSSSDSVGDMDSTPIIPAICDLRWLSTQPVTLRRER